MTTTQTRYDTWVVIGATGVTVQLRAVNAALTGWSVTILTPGYAQPGIGLVSRTSQADALAWAQSCADRAMTQTQLKELKARQDDYYAPADY